MDLSGDYHSKHGPDRHPIDHRGVGLLGIHPPFLHDSMGAYVGYVFDDPHIWSPFYVEGPYLNYVLLLVYFYSSNQVPVLVIIMITYFLPF